MLDWYSANCRLHLVAFSAAAVTLVRTPLAEQIAGTDDILTPIRGQLDLAQHIPGAWLAQFPGAGHGAMLQHPEQVAALVEAFLMDTAAGHAGAGPVLEKAASPADASAARMELRAMPTS